MFPIKMVHMALGVGSIDVGAMLKQVVKFPTYWPRSCLTLLAMTCGGEFPPNFQRPLAAKPCMSDRNMFSTSKIALASSVTMPSMVGLGFRAPPGDEKVLFICYGISDLNARMGISHARFLRYFQGSWAE